LNPANYNIRIEELTAEGFEPFGMFHTIAEPSTDIMELGMVGFSTCHVHQRPKDAHAIELHTSMGEGIMALSADIVMHVAEPTPWNFVHSGSHIRAFRVPVGTCAILNIGVWHHRTFLFKEQDQWASALILLPVRDCGNE
jgi:hypothetical protein